MILGLKQGSLLTSARNEDKFPLCSCGNHVLNVDFLEELVFFLSVLGRR